MVMDLFLVYQFVKRLSTPFRKWKAYKLGIIDENGNILRKTSELSTRDEKKAWGKFDVMMSKIKKIIEKLPEGRNKLISYSAALYLIKESDSINTYNAELMSEEDLIEEIIPYIEFVSEHYLIEEVPANNVGGGSIAGVGVGDDKNAEPGFTSSQMKKYKKKKKKIVTRLEG